MNSITVTPENLIRQAGKVDEEAKDTIASISLSFRTYPR